MEIKKKYIVKILIALLAIFSFLATYQPFPTTQSEIQGYGDIMLSSSIIIYVDDDNIGIEDGSLAHPYNTIQEGIDAAGSGDKVYVFSGIYHENIIINKILTLEGDDKDTTIIDGDGSGTVVFITYINDVVITEFTVKKGNIGIWCYHASSSKILNCEVVSNYQFGIHLEYSSHSEVKNCEISDTYGPGGVGVQLGIAIRTWRSLSSKIEDVEIFNNENDFRVFQPYQSTGTIIRNVEMHHNKGGICAGYGSYHFDNLYIHDNGRGIMFNGASGGSLKNSILYNISDVGVRLTWYSSSNVIKENVIMSNDMGIVVTRTVGSNNRLYHNDIIDNIQQVNMGSEAPSQIWDNGYPSGGNYWSDYTGSDLFNGPNQDIPGCDGIGDIPYWITGIDKDNYPLMQPMNFLTATIDIDPDTLNLKTNGKWVTAYIELPYGYDVNNIEISSIRLTVESNEFSVDLGAPYGVGDYDIDGSPDLMVKFDRQEIVASMETVDYFWDLGNSELVEFIVYGNVNNNFFTGSEFIRVI